MVTNDSDEQQQEDFRFRFQFQRELLEKLTRVQRSDRDIWQRSKLDLGRQRIELFAWMSPLLIPVAKCTVLAYGILSCFHWVLCGVEILGDPFQYQTRQGE